MSKEIEKSDSIEKEEDNEQVEHPSSFKSSKPVIVDANAYKTIILYASRYANQALSPNEWKEIYGILTGYVDDDFLHVKNAYALTFGHDTDVQLDERHYVFIDEIQQKLDEEGNDYFVVGWFHSHPGLSLFFSYIDLINQLGFQAKFDEAIGLVFDHTLLGRKKVELIGENRLTKYDTGFEIYRLTDVNLDPNSPEYENNYHKVDYLVEGLNKYFFANVLSELSALVTAGKPLQSAYGEKKSNVLQNDDVISEIDMKPEKQDLVKIPIKEDVQFNIDDLFYYDDLNLEQKENAERLIYEGDLAFQKRDTFSGVEKYRKAIEIYKSINETERVLDLLRNIIKFCISNNHLVLAEDFAQDLLNLSEYTGSLFYQAVATYILGYAMLKKGDNSLLKSALNKVRDAAILFEKVGDFAGAGMCFNKIGTIYQTRLENYDSAGLFLREAVENYNKAIVSSHPLRKSLWSKPELLKEKVIELKDLIEEILPSILNESIKTKIINDLNLIQYNF
jgi:proteasome lid subunit RPN8/RPN11